MIKIDIVIPIYNEEKNIGTLLSYLVENCYSSSINNIIVVDGGSTDNSFEIINKFPEVTLLTSEKGRAKQMNTGAAHSVAEIIYFLHADSFPPSNFGELISIAYIKGKKAGCFRLEFDHAHWWLKLAAWFTRFNWRICRGGDQSLFIESKLFDEIGGFDENYKIYEDNILIGQLYDQKEFTVIQKPIKTSARAYKRVGIWKLQYHFWAIYFKRWMGASAEDLHEYYAKHIA